MAQSDDIPLASATNLLLNDFELEGWEIPDAIGKLDQDINTL